MKKPLRYCAFLLPAVILSAAVAVFLNTRDRHPGYYLDIDVAPGPPSVISAGFSALTINPALADTWVDTGGNARFRPRDGDSYIDNTGSGRFDAVWLAGFHGRRPAQGQSDDLWVRVMALDDGRTRIAWAVLDAIGMFHCDVVDIRNRLHEDLGIDYCIVSCTHTHSAPDLLGLWGPNPFVSGVDKKYIEHVKSQTVEAVKAAVGNLRPARLRFASDSEGAVKMMEVSRKPYVVDGALRIMQAVDYFDGSVFGTLVVWDNHPETLWSGNLLVSSDFPHYLRKGIEEGVYSGGEQLARGFGGVAVYAAGNTGGLMTTSPRKAVSCPFTGAVYTEPSFDKARAQGAELARLVIEAVNSGDAAEMEKGSITLRAKTIEIPLDNNLFRIAGAIGLIKRGLSGWLKVRSEICFWRIGPASFLHHPGELFPEIAEGGIEAPPGRDFDVPPQELPPLRSVMPGKYRFIAGLSSDMIGYIIPKSQWDARPPYTYGYEKRPYGEINSLGPETGPLLHSAMLEIIADAAGSRE